MAGRVGRSRCGSPNDLVQEGRLEVVPLPPHRSPLATPSRP